MKLIFKDTATLSLFFIGTLVVSALFVAAFLLPQQVTYTADTAPWLIFIVSSGSIFLGLVIFLVVVMAIEKWLP